MIPKSICHIYIINFPLNKKKKKPEKYKSKIKVLFANKKKTILVYWLALQFYWNIILINYSTKESVIHLVLICITQTAVFVSIIIIMCITQTAVHITTD